MKTVKIRRIGALLLVSLGLCALGGCVATGGYGSAYYAPDYSGYYGDYGYYGDPYWGGGPYVGSTIVIGGHSHRGYYGGHHFSHDFHGRGSAIHSPVFHGGGGRGGIGGHVGGGGHGRGH